MRAVKCVETGEVYQSITMAAREVGISTSMIQACCAGACSIAGGYHWMYSGSEESGNTTNLICVKRYGILWGVFYKDTLLKTFKSSICAYTYANDSALDDVRILGLITQDARMVHRIRHVETGKIYPSIKQAGEALGISPCGIGRVLNGLKETVKGQHFERVK